MPESALPSLHHDPAPTLPLMHATFILAGFGTMLLGPILPLLSQRWHLTDSQSGLMVLAQFCGATLGGSTVSSRLQRDMLLGLAAAAVGFLGFAFAPGLNLACAALFVGGFGVGRTIATVNIIGGARYTKNRGSALSRLNFTWSFGALLSPLLAAWLIRLSLQTRLAAFAALFLVCAVALAMQIRRAPNTTAANAAAAESTHPLPLTSPRYSSSTAVSRPASVRGSQPTHYAMAQRLLCSANTPWSCCSAASQQDARWPHGFC